MTMHAVAGDANRAQVIWKKAAGQDEAFPITALGVAFRGCGDLERAMQVFLRAEELGDGYAMEYRARILAGWGRHEEADALRARAATAERML
ncbi:hypothetical protein ACFWBN_09390 [Streptomyces sp. NPDC059989]|uniref:hypothetical protein n=1 Tax=Streptomyces sp. NPDC059989 TaxID=3347026 RepID=UPI0036BAD252